MADSPENPGSQGPSAPPPFQPVASQYQPVGTPSPVYGAPPPAPVPAKSGGSSAIKIILIIVGIFVFLGVLVVAVIGYGVYKVRKAIHVDSSTGAATLSVPGMSMNADPGMKFSASELGTEIYPGATTGKSGNMRMNIAGSSVVAATFLTSDAKEKVVEFYKDKLGSEATSMDFGQSALLTLKKTDHDQLTVTISQEANQANGMTQIHIQHTTTAQAK